MFEVYAYLAGDTNKIVFNGTMSFLPRLEEFVSIDTYIFKVKSIRYILEKGTFKIPKVRMALEQIL